MASDILNIDGSVLEGGGQILRNAAALSCITGQAITVTKIRASRDNPGLRPQHLSGLEIIRDLSRGQLTNAKVGSSAVTLRPGSLDAGEFLADTKTAGSICLLIQAALPCILFARGATKVVLRGGTNASMAPPFDYFTWVLKPMLERWGVTFECELRRRGFYPRGGGEVVLTASPVHQIEPITLTERGEFTKITGLSFCAGALPIKVANIMAETAKAAIKRKYPNLPINVEVVKETEQNAVGTGSAILLVAETSTGCRIAGSGLGSKGLKAEDVGQKAAEELLSNMQHGGCVDEYLQDQLIIFMALAQGRSKVLCGPLTLHTETAIHVAQLLTRAKFIIDKLSDSSTMIQCDGIGQINTSIQEK